MLLFFAPAALVCFATGSSAACVSELESMITSGCALRAYEL